VPLPRLALDCRQAAGWNTGGSRKMGRMAHDNKMQIAQTRSRRGAEAPPSEKKGREPRACGNSGSDTRPHSLTLARFANDDTPELAFFCPGGALSGSSATTERAAVLASRPCKSGSRESHPVRTVLRPRTIRRRQLPAPRAR
jgi:hypothetical protein